MSLNQVIKDALELLAYQLRVDNVEIELRLVDNLPALWADPHQLHQVVVNLVTNAQQAMRGYDGSRKLSVVTAANAERTRVWLEVADTGPGIPPAIRSRIFEPFFTTKPPGQGTGLGLSLCQGIIEEHDGSIQVESEPGHGAVFRIELPVKVPPTAEREAPAFTSPRPAAPLSILVVDDEPEVANVLVELLRADGHEVETADNGAIALQKLGRRAYDVILSDLRMPELDGPALCRELERVRPELLKRFVFVTGDTLGPDTKEFLARVGTRCLNKPFALDEVRSVIAQLLRLDR